MRTTTRTRRRRARERYNTLGAIGKEAAPEAIEAQLDDVMDVDGYLSWLAFNTLVRNAHITGRG